MFSKQFIIDKQKPKLLECPGRIVKETANKTLRIFWDPPKYEDNCGNYTNCPVDVIPIGPISGSDFAAPSISTISYTARDPSGNTNEECTFTVEVKKKLG